MEKLREFLASGALILFNAITFYELLAPEHNFASIRLLYKDKGTWNNAFRYAFTTALGLKYDRIFGYALQILDILPPSRITEQILEEIYKVAEYVTSHAVLFRHDLIGRIYHSMLGRELAKAFATYYTKLYAAELLAWLAIENYDNKVVDFACGSGTLLVAAYHRKLALAFLQGYSGSIEELHRLFIEEQLWGFDAMAFATHMAAVNLALQQPTAVFARSKIYHVPCGKDRMGSLDLLKENRIKILSFTLSQEKAVGPSQVSVSEKKVTEIEIPREKFDVVIMNPPFTRKDRATKVLNTKELSKIIKRFDPRLSTLGGLAVPFVKLGDLYVKSGGRVAFVLPTAVLSRDAWLPIRHMLIERYNIEYLIISWISGAPAFSEESKLREILLVARKLKEEEEPGYSIICHLDEQPSFLDARRIAERLKELALSPRIADITRIGTNQRYLVFSDKKLLGEAFSVPPAIMKTVVDNLYVLLAFRDFQLVKSALSLMGVHTSGLWFFDELSQYLTELTNIGNVKLFVKNVEAAGFRILEGIQEGIPIVASSLFDKIEVNESDCKWLVRDPALPIKERFKPGVGKLLIIRKGGVDSLRVFSIASERPVAGNMWVPVEPKRLSSNDGTSINSSDVARMLSLWFNSTFGLISLLAFREETTGVWSEWKTERVRILKTLNPKTLDSSQIESLLSLWHQLKEVRWEPLYTQLDNAIRDENHPRRILDKGIVNTICKKEIAESELTALYNQVIKELIALKRLMRVQKRK